MKKIIASLMAIYIALLFVPTFGTTTVTLSSITRLWKALNLSQKQSITDLTISGQMNYQDFITLRDSMPVLTKVDMSGATIIAATVGTTTQYPANQLPVKAFYLNTNLQSIILPPTCNDIGDGAFAGCSGLINLTLPTTQLVSIGSNAFNSCTNLISFTLNCTSTSAINPGAFQGCTNLISITLKGVQSIGASAFDGCTKLNSVDLSASNVTGIDVLAFNNCKSLTSIILPQTLVQLGSISQNLPVFAGTQITSINIPANVNIIGKGAFASMKSLSSITVSSSNTSYIAINNTLFDKNQTLIIAVAPSVSDTYIIPQSITTVGYKSFYNCDKIQTIYIGGNITTIEDSAFSKCSSLSTVYVKGTTPPSLGGSGCFFGNSPSRRICTTIGNYSAFYALNTWRTLGLVKPVTKTLITTGGTNFNIDVVNTFQGRTDTISSLKIQGYLSTSNFVDLRNRFPLLNDLDIKGVTIEYNKIPDNAFANLTSLVTIALPDGSNGKLPVKRIGKNAFQNCPILGNVVVPSTLDSIYDKAFDQCLTLNNFSFSASKNIKYIGKSAFRNCKLLSFSTLPDSITSIPDSAFYHCFKMPVYLSIPINVTTIGKNAFDSCYSIQSLTFGKSVSSIGENAFANCTKIYSITLPTLAPPSITSTPFASIPLASGKKNCNLSIPVESYNNYNADANWSTFLLNPKALAKQCYLTILFQNGTVKLDGNLIPSGTSKLMFIDSTTCKIDATPYTGYTVGSVTLNGTPLNIVGGVYTTNKINQNATLNVNFTKIPCSFNIYTIESILTETVSYGTRPTFSVTPQTSWTISTATYTSNGNTIDVISQLKGGTFTPTDSITGNVDFKVTYKQTTPVAQLATKDLKIYSVNMDILVNGVVSGDKIDVYTADGILVTSVIADGDTVTIPVATNGVYLIKTSAYGNYKLRI